MEIPWPGKTFYAVDSNIIAAFLDPVSRATSLANGRIGIGEIFRDDPLDLKIAICRRLITRLFESLTIDHGFISIAPISRETSRILYQHFGAILESGQDNIARQVADLQHNTQMMSDHLKRRFPHHEEIFSPEKLEWQILKDIDDEAKRIYTLFVRQRLIGDWRVSAKSHSETLQAALAPARDIFEQIEFSRVKIKWERKLSEVGRKLTDNSGDDADLLARLELSNRHLHHFGLGERLCYITQDSSILAAGDRVMWEYGKLPESFSKCFLRHPRAFLDKLDIFSPSINDPRAFVTTIFDWLVVLLGRFDDALRDLQLDHGKIDLSRNIIDSLGFFSEQDPDYARSIGKTWHDFAERLVVDPPSLMDRVRRLIDGSAKEDEVQAIINEISATAREDLDLWYNVLAASVATRFALEVSAPVKRFVSHEAVTLVFSERPHLAAFIEAARGWLDSPDEFTFGEYEVLRAKVRVEDSSGYGDLLAHGYLLTQAGQWRTATILAQYATARATAILPLSYAGNNGRESAYLEACCRRIDAKNVGDLSGLKALCDEAIEIATKERSESVDFDAVIERFHVEKLMIDLTILLFNWSSNGDIDARIEIYRNEALALESRFHQFAIELWNKLSSYSQNQLGVIEALDGLVERCARAALSILLQFGDPKAPDWITRRQDLINILGRKAVTNAPRAEMSKLVRDICGALTGARSRKRGRDLLEDAANLSLHYKFDRDRRDIMLNNARDHLGLSA